MAYMSLRSQTDGSRSRAAVDCPDNAASGVEPHYLPPLLRRAWYGLNQAFRRRISHLNLTPDQFTVLRNLAETAKEGLTQKELCRRMASDANTVGALIERMEDAGLLRRQPDPNDRRAKRVHIKARGCRKLEEANGFAQELHDAVVTSLPPSERSRFLRQLARVADACQTALALSPRPSRRSGAEVR